MVCLGLNLDSVIELIHSIWWSIVARQHTYSNSTNTPCWLISYSIKSVLWYVKVIGTVLPLISGARSQECSHVSFHFYFSCHTFCWFYWQEQSYVFILCSIKSEIYWFLLIDSRTTDTFTLKQDFVWKRCVPQLGRV